MKSIFLTFLITFFFFREGSTGRFLDIQGVKYYFGFPEEVDWYTARHHCMELGLELVEIHSEKLNIAFKEALNLETTILRPLPYNFLIFWLGGIRDPGQSYYRWTNSGLLLRDGYTNWGRKYQKLQPRDGKAFCVVLGGGGGARFPFSWLYRHCDDSFNYICGPAKRRVEVHIFH